MVKMRMRLLRFALLVTTAWATQWQQTPLQQHVPIPPSQSFTSDSAAQQFSALDTVAANAMPSEQAMIPHEQPPQQEDMPEMKLEHVSLSLRLTCEMNRRLLQGIRNNNLLAGTSTTKSASTHQSTSSSNPLLQRGGDDALLVTPQHHPVNIHPSQSWQPPISTTCSKIDTDDLSIFHAKSPRTNTKRRGVARWGPDLTQYLHYLISENVLDIPQDQQSLIMALTLVYLDRACSVETVRTSGSPKCPFCTPRTVHRLLLVSLLTATRAVVVQRDGDVLSSKIQESLGIPPTQLEQMQHAFMHALGDHGLYVDALQLNTFLLKWKSRFNGRRQQPQQTLPVPQQYVWA